MSKTKEDEAAQRGYDVGQWKGRPQFRCLQCPFDSLQEQPMVEHVRSRHGSAPRPTRPASVPLYDRFGNLIEEV